MLKEQEFDLFSGTKKIGKFYLGSPLKVTLQDNLEYMDIPIHFENGYEKGERSFEGEIVEGYISDRVCPSGRHNIDAILKEAGLQEYSKLGLFLHYDGRCVRDKFRIKRVTN